MTTATANQIAQLQSSIARVIRGKDEVIRLSIVALLARGHLLIEDVPGVGKTTLAQALANSFHCSFQRIQFTSDLLPSDVVGTSIYNQMEQRFDFKPGPIFANIVLADEINRTTPKTQSALLEAMNEAQVTVDNFTHKLPRPFMVLATQNPIEHHGTYPLPESQLDRFLLRIGMGYPSRESEREIMRQHTGGRDAAAEVSAVMEAATSNRCRKRSRECAWMTACAITPSTSSSARAQANSSRWRPSRPRATRSAPPRTCTRSASSSTSCSPARCPSTARRR